VRRRIRTDSPTPIGSQLRELLLQEIRNGRFPLGKRIPSERELAENYSISRASVRESLAQLVSEGILFRAVGKGTFVSQPQPDRMVAGRTPTIAFIVSKSLAEFFQIRQNRILAGVEEAIRTRGYRLVFQAFGNDGRSGLKELSRNGAAPLDGCVIAGALRRQVLEHLQELGIPVVVVDRATAQVSPDFITVRSDYARGTRLAMQHLRELGHRDIGFLGFSDSQKYQAYCECLEQFGLPYRHAFVEFIQLFDLPPAILAGYQTMQRMIATRRLPTALLVTNDLVAVGVMEALGVAGIRVPDEISVISFDDLGHGTSPPLTRIRADLIEVGRAAGEILLRRLEGERLETNHIVMPVDFIKGKSTASPQQRPEFANANA
jgi:GntR family transcriptional regulator of arabinose operon